MAAAMSGDPFSMTGRLARTFATGDNSKGAIYLGVIEKRKRNADFLPARLSL